MEVLESRPSSGVCEQNDRNIDTKENLVKYRLSKSDWESIGSQAGWLKTAKRGGCWRGFKQVGMKSKGGRMVPNCVPSKKK
jgi:hypothetical protein